MTYENKRFVLRSVDSDGWYGSYSTGLYDSESGTPDEPIACDGGEPEDNSFDRDWRWVPTMLNDLDQENKKLKLLIRELISLEELDYGDMGIFCEDEPDHPVARAHEII